MLAAIIDLLDTHAGAIQAVSTIVLVIVTWKLTQITRTYADAAKSQADQAKKQVDETQRLADVSIRQVDETQQQRFEQHLPVVHPLGRLPLTENYQVDWSAPGYDLQLQNAGTGVALILNAVMFPPEGVGPPNQLPPRYAVWREPPLLAGQPARSVTLEQGRCRMEGDATIGEHRLLAPRMPTPAERMMGEQYRVIARLTLTYQDIFMRKHAAIFDYIDIYGWQCVALIRDAPRDLDEIEQERVRREQDAAKQASALAPSRLNRILRH